MSKHLSPRAVLQERLRKSQLAADEKQVSGILASGGYVNGSGHVNGTGTPGGFYVNGVGAGAKSIRKGKDGESDQR